MTSTPRLRIPLLVLVLLAVGPVTAAKEDGPVWDRKTAKAAADLAVRWFKARPQTRFTDWDPAVRRPLVEEAKGFGAIPEGKLDDVVRVLAKEMKRYGPHHRPGGKPTIETPFGEAWFLVNGSGRGKGLVIGLHGGGPGAGDASEATKWHAKRCMGMYPQGIILVHDTWNTVHGERFVLTLIEIAKAQYQIDPDRVYVMGFSMGGTGSWFMAGRHPDLFAGAIPAHGVLMASPKSQVETKEEVGAIQPGFVPNVRNLALWYYTGLADKNCMPGTYLFVNDIALPDWKKRDPGGYGKIHFASYPGVAHTFPPGEPGKGIAFIEEQRRETFPRTITWEYAARPFPLEGGIEGCERFVKRNFYWLKCARPVDGQYIHGEIEDNVITLDVVARPKTGITIYLNDRMIDPEKEVVVRIGKDEVYRGRPVPDFLTILETLDARVDTSMVFDRRIEL